MNKKAIEFYTCALLLLPLSLISTNQLKANIDKSQAPFIQNFPQPLSSKGAQSNKSLMQNLKEQAAQRALDKQKVPLPPQGTQSNKSLMQNLKEQAAQRALDKQMNNMKVHSR